MKGKISDLTKIYFALLLALIFCFQTNGQTKDTFIRKLRNGTEMFQRKSESIEILDGIDPEKLLWKKLNQKSWNI